MADRTRRKSMPAISLRDERSDTSRSPRFRRASTEKAPQLKSVHINLSTDQNHKSPRLLKVSSPMMPRSIMKHTPRAAHHELNNNDDPKGAQIPKRRRHSVQIVGLTQKQLAQGKSPTMEHARDSHNPNNLDVEFSPRRRANSWVVSDSLYDVDEGMERKLPEGSDDFQIVMNDFKQKVTLQD